MSTEVVAPGCPRGQASSSPAAGPPRNSGPPRCRWVSPGIEDGRVSSRVSAPLAPTQCQAGRSPFGRTGITHADVWTSGLRTSRVVSTPSLEQGARRTSAIGSSPIAPMLWTSAPSRARTTPVPPAVPAGDMRIVSTSGAVGVGGYRLHAGVRGCRARAHRRRRSPRVRGSSVLLVVRCHWLHGSVAAVDGRLDHRCLGGLVEDARACRALSCRWCSAASHSSSSGVLDCLVEAWRRSRPRRGWPSAPPSSGECAVAPVSERGRAEGGVGRHARSSPPSRSCW